MDDYGLLLNPIMLSYSSPTSSHEIKVSEGDLKAMEQYGHFAVPIVQLQALTLMDSYPELYTAGILLCRPHEDDLTSVGRLLLPWSKFNTNMLLEKVFNATKKSAAVTESAAWSYLVVPIRQDLRWSLLVLCHDSRRAYRFDTSLRYIHTPSGETREDGRNSSAASYWEAISTKLLFGAPARYATDGLPQSSEGGFPKPQLLNLTTKEKLKKGALADCDQEDQFSIFTGNDKLVQEVPQCEADESGAIICVLMQMIVEHATFRVDRRFPAPVPDLESYFETLTHADIVLRQQKVRNKMYVLTHMLIEKENKKKYARAMSILYLVGCLMVVVLLLLFYIRFGGSMENFQAFLGSK